MTDTRVEHDVTFKPPYSDQDGTTLTLLLEPEDATNWYGDAATPTP